MAHIETETEWENKMCGKIIEYLAGQIYIDMRFLEPVLSVLVPRDNRELETFATNGEYIYMNPLRTINVFKSNERFLIRAYLHSVLHCVYSHLWIRQNRDIKLWNIACDIAVEQVIDGINKPCTKRILTWTRQNLYSELNKSNIISSAQIYEYILNKSDDEICELEREFYVDSHYFWKDESKQKSALAETKGEIQKQWEKRAREVSMNKDKASELSEGENKLEELIRNEKAKRSYRDFLKHFSRIHEEMKCSEDEFDLGYYTYGLSRYENMPLIEPLETREVSRIREFVVAVDTSYSTSGELVRRFLEETFSILMDSESFLKQSIVHVIQCDSVIQSHVILRDNKDIRLFFKSFELKGGGSTDFRPVFKYVNKLMEDGELKQLEGLIYFTDGLGIYPKKRPDYKSAFIYLKDYDENEVPAWAIKLRVDENSFRI